jgi:hypothetical protein
MRSKGGGFYVIYSLRWLLTNNAQFLPPVFVFFCLPLFHAPGRGCRAFAGLQLQHSSSRRTEPRAKFGAFRLAAQLNGRTGHELDEQQRKRTRHRALVAGWPFRGIGVWAFRGFCRHTSVRRINCSKFTKTRFDDHRKSVKNLEKIWSVSFESEKKCELYKTEQFFLTNFVFRKIKWNHTSSIQVT